jgi:hypothetical protein
VQAVGGQRRALRSIEHLILTLRLRSGQAFSSKEKEFDSHCVRIAMLLPQTADRRLASQFSQLIDVESASRRRICSAHPPAASLRAPAVLNASRNWLLRHVVWAFRVSLISLVRAVARIATSEVGAITTNMHSGQLSRVRRVSSSLVRDDDSTALCIQPYAKPLRPTLLFGHSRSDARPRMSFGLRRTDFPCNRLCKLATLQSLVRVCTNRVAADPGLCSNIKVADHRL